MHIRDYLSQRPPRRPHLEAWETEWLDIAPLHLKSGTLAICDPTLFPSAYTAISLAPGGYHVQARIAEYGRHRLVSRLRAALDGAHKRGQMVGTVGVDFGQVGVCDLALVEAACEDLDEAAQDAIIAALDAPSLWGIAPWDPATEALMPFVNSGFGDGQYPVYELLAASECVGVEVVFIDLTEAETPSGDPR